VNVTLTEIAELVMAIGLSSSILLSVMLIGLRFAIRPLIADWDRLRGPAGNGLLEQRMAEMEEEVRRLRAGVAGQLPAGSPRSPEHPRT